MKILRPEPGDTGIGLERKGQMTLAIAILTEPAADLPQWMAVALIAFFFVALVGLLYHFRRRTPTLTMVVESRGAQMLHNLRGVIEHYSDGVESRMRMMPESYVHEFATNLVTIGHRPGDPAPAEEAAILERVEVFALDIDDSFSWGTKDLNDPTMLMRWVRIYELVHRPDAAPEATETPVKAEEPTTATAATS